MSDQLSASVPALPGCYSQGETRDEALENVREAAELTGGFYRASQRQLNAFAFGIRRYDIVRI